MNKIIVVLLLLSGVSALIYQVVWIRLLGLSIGVTSAAVGAVLAAVFLGMAAGAWLSSYAERGKFSALKLFAAVELTVGISAFLLLPIMLNLDQILALLPSLSSELWFRFTVVVLMLAIPASGLGAAYPLVSYIVIKREKEIGSGLSLLYFSYTLGAVVGALVCAFVLIPSWGLDGALYSAIAINLLVACSAAIVSRYQLAPDELKDNRQQAQRVDQQLPDGTWLGAVVLIVTGLSAIAVEAGWVKYLSIYIGSTIYGFSILMAIFLSGITVGSLIANLSVQRIKDLPFLLLTGLLLLGAVLFLNRTALGYLPSIESYIDTLQLNYQVESILNYAAVIIMVTPVAILLGFFFPLSMMCFCGDLPHLGTRAGVGYALNTIAGLVGATLAGLWLIPGYGTDALLIVVALFVSVVTMTLGYFILKGRRKAAVTFTAVVVALVGVSLPGLNFEKMIICIECNAALIEEGRGPEVLFSQEGHTGVISLVKNDNGIVELKNNSLNEAMLPLSRARGEILLGLLPSVFLPDAKSSLLIGYGAGTTASVLAATPLESIKVVELEPAVVKAMQTLQGETIPQLQDPRLSIIYNDARNVLQLEKQRYDIVISQPSHPWRNGASQLFTSEFFETVSSRLSEKGTFVQWINLFHMDIPTLKSLVASFYHVFPKGAVFVHRSPEQLFLLGSKEPLILDRTSVDKVFQRPAMNKILRQANMHNANRLLHYFLFTRKEALEMAGDAEHVTDLNLLPEVRLGHADFETNSIEIYNLLQKHALSLQGNVSSN